MRPIIIKLSGVTIQQLTTLVSFVDDVSDPPGHNLGEQMASVAATAKNWEVYPSDDKEDNEEIPIIRAKHTSYMEGGKTFFKVELVIESKFYLWDNEEEELHGPISTSLLILNRIWDLLDLFG